MRGRTVWTGLTVAVALAALAVFSAGAHAVSVSFTGPEEMVYDYSTMRCDDLDVPDGPTWAIRDSTNRIQLVARSPSRRMVGPDFDNLTLECGSLLTPGYDPNPAHYNYIGGLTGPYTENGKDVYALVGNEYHGWERPGECPSGRPRRCNSSGIAFAVSHDNGDTYSMPAPPANFVAAVPPRETVDFGRAGLFAPIVPIKKGNYYYALSMIQALGDQDAGVCVMRTRDITDPSSWRGWDGSAFSVRFVNPYYHNTSPQRTHMCEPASPSNILQMARSVTYNTYLNKYVLTGNAVVFDPVQSRNVFGFYFSLSDDLVHWSMRQLLMEADSLTSHVCGGPDPLAYPSLIDPSSTDRNFRITDATMHLYYIRMHFNEACQLTFDRDLLRIPIQFSQ